MKWILVICSLILAFEPAIWLGRTWLDPTWGSFGEWVFLLVVFIVTASVKSSPAGLDGRAWRLFAVSAGARLLGKFLAVNVIGALALVVDIYAIGRLLQLDRRKFSVSPIALAFLFALSLPIERIVQRIIGFHLQLGSAGAAEQVLRLFYDAVSRTGIDLTIGQTHVLVDVPCSGARGMTITAVVFVALAAIKRPGFKMATIGAGIAALGCFVSNTGRIVTLAIGIVEGVDVMAQPLHDIVGLVWLAVAFGMLIGWARLVEDRSAGKVSGTLKSRAVSPIWAIAAVAACLALLVVPERPIDASSSVVEIELPTAFGNRIGEQRALTEQETSYFKKYGGDAAKTTYGDMTLMAIRTSSPLRHLHSPEACLRGSGFSVERLGIDFDRPLPATIYSAERDGQMYTIEVTYLSSTGAVATNVSEAVSRWIANPSTQWTAVQRISPEHSNPAVRKRFDQKLKHHFSTQG